MKFKYSSQYSVLWWVGGEADVENEEENKQKRKRKKISVTQPLVVSNLSTSK